MLDPLGELGSSAVWVFRYHFIRAWFDWKLIFCCNSIAIFVLSVTFSNQSTHLNPGSGDNMPEYFSLQINTAVSGSHFNSYPMPFCPDSASKMTAAFPTIAYNSGPHSVKRRRMPCPWLIFCELALFNWRGSTPVWRNLRCTMICSNNTRRELAMHGNGYRWRIHGR
jgi:hypothetical protein